MAVLGGVAVPGEVLAAGGDPAALQTLGERDAQPRHLAGSAPKLRSPMTGFAGLVSTSSTGAKSQSKPGGAELEGEQPPHLPGEPRVPALPDGPASAGAR